jgi:hypothetical protein
VTSKDIEKMRLEKRIQWLLEVNNKQGVQLLKEKYRRKYGK